MPGLPGKRASDDHATGWAECLDAIGKLVD
jgi:hypothetical protein